MAEKRKMKLVTRQQPHIETLQVSVQVVRIGPKQMTQAVFRQLIKEDLLDQKTGEWHGVPWGTVNYFWDACGFNSWREYGAWRPDHIHVVWQKGEDIRRDCIPSNGAGMDPERKVFWQECLEVIEALPQLFIAV